MVNGNYAKMFGVGVCHASDHKCGFIASRLTRVSGNTMMNLKRRRRVDQEGRPSGVCGRLAL